MKLCRASSASVYAVALTLDLLILLPYQWRDVKRVARNRVELTCLSTFAALCYTMKDRLCTVTEAAFVTGIARTTIQRWLREEKIEKKSGGAVSLADVEKCKKLHATGRPLGRPVTSRQSLAEQLAEPFLGGEGLRRLRTVLKILALEWSGRGKGQQFTDALADAVPNIKTGKLGGGGSGE